MTVPAANDAKYRVIVYAAPDEAQELGDVLESVLGLHATDALILARAAPGPLGDVLTRELAERLVAEISQIGLRADAVPADEVPEFRNIVVVHHARCLDAGLDVLGLNAEEKMLIAWNNIDLISVGQVPQETSRHYPMAEMVTAARRTSHSPTDMLLTPGPCAWFVCRNPSCELRVDHKRMNYEYLAQRKTFSATANFRLFLDDVIARARAAYLTPSTRDYLEHGSVTDYSFGSAEALKRDAILHLLIHRRSVVPPSAGCRAD
jgi:hypothetical protein